jgi:putative nucleotidyltransferase with HDIG domain
MTAAVENLLRDLQGVVSARHLYPPDHPRLTDIVDRVVAQASDLTAANAEVSVFIADNRLVWENAPLPNGDTLARGIFAALRAHGFQRLSIRRGLTAPEIVAFANAVIDATLHPSASGKLASSGHIRFSAIDDSGEHALEGQVDVSMSKEGEEALTRVWTGVIDQRRLDFDALEFMMIALARTVDQSVAALIPLADLKAHDDYTVTHIVNVALLATALAEAVGFPSTLIKDIGIAALLHDVGKLRVPADVLNSAGQLTPEQRALIRRHPEDGARILMATPGVPQLAVAVAFEHHLQYDGGGYPAVPSGWRINVASEITHIADVFDALRSNRPYRAGMPHERIISLMSRDAGTVFDPALIRLFMEEVMPRTAAAPPEAA